MNEQENLGEGGEVSPHSVVSVDNRYDDLKAVFGDAVEQYEEEHHLLGNNAKKDNRDNSLFSIFATLCCFAAPPLPSNVSLDSFTSSSRSTIGPSTPRNVASFKSASASARHKKHAEQMQITAINTAYSYLGLPMEKSASNKGLTMAYPRWDPNPSNSTADMPVCTCETAASKGFKGVKYDCIVYADKQKVFDFLISDVKAVESDANLLGFEVCFLSKVINV